MIAALLAVALQQGHGRCHWEKVSSSSAIAIPGMPSSSQHSPYRVRWCQRPRARTRSYVTPRSWAVSLLQTIHAPANGRNVYSILQWEATEATLNSDGTFNTPDWYNPLNTTMPEPGAYGTNGPGVRHYTGWRQGMKATVAALYDGWYPHILWALHRGRGLVGCVSCYADLKTWSGQGYGAVMYHPGYGGGAGRLVSLRSPRPHSHQPARAQGRPRRHGSLVIPGMPGEVQ